MRRIPSAITACAVAALFVITGSEGRGSSVRADVLETSEVSSAFLRTVIGETNFDVDGKARPLHNADGSVGAYASMAPVTRRSGDSTTLAGGMIVARINVDRAFPDYALRSGHSYLWVDRHGPADDPWRAIIVSQDGDSRVPLGSLTFKANASHSGGSTIADHARAYCEGDRACFFTQPASSGSGRVFDSIWSECVNGCCQTGGGGVLRRVSPEDR